MEFKPAVATIIDGVRYRVTPVAINLFDNAEAFVGLRPPHPVKTRGWEYPQGGLDYCRVKQGPAETILEGAAREGHEEAHISGTVFLALLARFYRYPIINCDEFDYNLLVVVLSLSCL